MATARAGFGLQAFIPKISIGRSRGLLIAILVFLIAFAIVNTLSKGPFAYYDLSYMTSGGATVALAAIGESIVVLAGGFDLSVGAVISLTDVILATYMHDSPGSEVLLSVIGLLVGATFGAFNGVLIAYVRMQPIVVTLATMFIAGGTTLLIQDTPGGQLPAGFSKFFTGDAIPNLLPAPLVVMVLALVIWGLFKHSRFGTALYAIGSDEHAATFAGIRVLRTKFFAYVMSGIAYGAAGVMVTAQTGFGDPLIGGPLLLLVFTAVVIGGTILGGGRGGCVGPAIGAYTLMLIVNILLVLNVTAYYSTTVTGILLILAAVGGSLSRRTPIISWLSSFGKGGAHQPHAEMKAPPLVFLSSALPAKFRIPWRLKHADLIRFAAPSYVCFILVVIATAILYRRMDFNYVNSLIVLGTFLTVLALGQGAVVLSGGLDLSVPWTITLCGILFTSFANASDHNTIWAIPAVLAVGAFTGLLNGLGIVCFELPPIVVTLAMNGIVQGAALIYSNGAAAIGFAPPGLRWVMNGSLWGFTPSVILTIAFVIFATILMGRTSFGRRIYAVGNSRRVARLSGVNVGATIVLVYMLSGVCSALVGILFDGYSGQASLDMGQEYLLSSIAIVVVGGTLITGGRGYYLGTIGGVLLLISLQTLLAGTTLPDAVRQIIYGLVVLIAVVALRDRAIGR